MPASPICVETWLMVIHGRCLAEFQPVESVCCADHVSPRFCLEGGTGKYEPTTRTDGCAFIDHS